jgi:hypothetical protein
MNKIFKLVTYSYVNSVKLNHLDCILQNILHHFSLQSCLGCHCPSTLTSDSVEDKRIIFGGKKKKKRLTQFQKPNFDFINTRFIQLSNFDIKSV